MKKLNREFNKNKNSINLDNYDKIFYKRIRDTSKEIRRLEKEGESVVKTFLTLLEDSFAILYKYKPELISDHQMSPDYMLNKAVISLLMGSSSYTQLRPHTELNLTNSTIATEVLGKEAIELLKNMPEQMEAQDELSGVMQEYQEAGGDAYQISSMFGEEDIGDAEGGKALPDQITLEEAKIRLEEAIKKYKDITSNSELVDRVNQALHRAVEEIKETTDIISEWGLGQDRTWEKTSYQEKMSLLDRIRNSEKLKRIAKLAGRFKRLALTQQRERVKVGMDEVYTVDHGAELNRIINSEKSKLASSKKVLRKLFYLNLIDRKTLVYQLRSKEKKQKGPIILAEDESGSMNGNPDIWAKAVALALLEIAQYQKRDFYMIHFGSVGQLHVNNFSKDKNVSAIKTIEMAEHFFSGGTDFMTPLNKAREIIGEEETYRKADIIFVSDGACTVTNNWLKDFNEWKSKEKVKIYGIHITENQYFRSSAVAMEEFCDSVDKVDDIDKNEKNLATDLFRKA